MYLNFLFLKMKRKVDSSFCSTVATRRVAEPQTQNGMQRIRADDCQSAHTKCYNCSKTGAAHLRQSCRRRPEPEGFACPRSQKGSETLVRNARECFAHGANAPSLVIAYGDELRSSQNRRFWKASKMLAIALGNVGELWLVTTLR